MDIDGLKRPITQAEFASLVQRSPGRISQWVRDGTLPEGETALVWLRSLVNRLAGQAAGRAASGDLSLAQERAALARSTRELNQLKLGVLRGQYAEIQLLQRVLSTASSAVAERFEQLPGRVRKACPDLPLDAIDAVMTVIAAARNEWVRETAELAIAAVESTDDDDPIEIIPDEPRAD